jgi:hypothetical protein
MVGDADDFQVNLVATAEELTSFLLKVGFTSWV